MRHPTTEELSMIPIFDEVAGSDLQWIEKVAQVQKIPKGTPLFREGSPGDAMYFIMSGEVDIIKESLEGKAVLLATLCKGAVLGEMSLVDSAPRSATAVAKRDVKLILLKKHSFQILTDEHPGPACKILLKLLRTLSLRLRQADSKVADGSS